VSAYLSRNFGVNYTGPWQHPMTPYRVSAKGERLPVHGQPSGVSYRDWLGLAQDDAEKGRSPALVVHAVKQDRHRVRRATPDAKAGGCRLWAFGYDMDNMKARAWVEGLMPLILVDPEQREDYERNAARLVRAAHHAMRTLAIAVRSALTGRPQDSPRRLDEVETRFTQATEVEFFVLMTRLSASSESHSDTASVRKRWLGQLAGAANQVFEESTSGGHFQATDPRRVALAWNSLQQGLRGKKMYEILELPQQAAAQRGRRQKTLAGPLNGEAP
jgi:CRISPR system Cascade subunit CasA